MKRETIRQNRINAAEKREYYTEREKYWARLEQEADDAESMKIIRKKKITPEQLAIFNRLSEKEVASILAGRDKENKPGHTGSEEEKEIDENAKKNS